MKVMKKYVQIFGFDFSNLAVKSLIFMRSRDLLAIFNPTNDQSDLKLVL